MTLDSIVVWSLFEYVPQQYECMNLGVLNIRFFRSFMNFITEIWRIYWTLKWWNKIKISIRLNKTYVSIDTNHFEDIIRLPCFPGPKNTIMGVSYILELFCNCSKQRRPSRHLNFSCSHRANPLRPQKGMQNYSWAIMVVKQRIRMNSPNLHNYTGWSERLRIIKFLYSFQIIRYFSWKTAYT